MPPRALLPPTSSPALPPTPDLADDMIYGVDNIARELGLDRLGAKRGAKAVYELHRKGGAPIFKLEGVGFAARRSALRGWVLRKEAEALDRRRGRE